MEEQFRPKETVGGSSPSRGTVVLSRVIVDNLYDSRCTKLKVP